MSSSLPPTTCLMPFARAFLANGDKKVWSWLSSLAIRAMLLAHCCNLTSNGCCEDEDDEDEELGEILDEDDESSDNNPDKLSLLAISLAIRLSGTLSKSPSVAKSMTSPSCTGNSYRSAASGGSVNTDPDCAISVGGRLNWKGVLKKCCCSWDRWTTWPSRTTKKPLSPMLAVYRVRSECESIMTHAVELPMICLRFSCNSHVRVTSWWCCCCCCCTYLHLSVSLSQQLSRLSVIEMAVFDQTFAILH